MPSPALSESYMPPNYGERILGAGKKGQGFFGPLKRKDGSISTELSADADVDGQKIVYPLLVPTLARHEIDLLLNGGDPTPEIHDKAIAHALMRMKAGRGAFAAHDEPFMPLPKALK